FIADLLARAPRSARQERTAMPRQTASWQDLRAERTPGIGVSSDAARLVSAAGAARAAARSNDSVGSPLAGLRRDLNDLVRPLFRQRYRDLDDAVMDRRLDLAGIHFGRQRDRASEARVTALAPKETLPSVLRLSFVGLL